MEEPVCPLVIKIIFYINFIMREESTCFFITLPYVVR